MTKRPKARKLLNRAMMQSAAKLHYIEGLSQLEVSRRMEVSTATVSRLLGLAREEGIVRIEVVELDGTDELQDRLSAALGLKTVRVTEGGKMALGAQAGSLLLEAGLAPGGVVAIGWGRTVQSVIAAGLPGLPGVMVVPTTGGLNETASHFQINEFVRMAAEQMGGKPQFLHAPSVVSPELHEVLIRDPGTARLIGHWDCVGAAILGVGSIQRGSSIGASTGFEPEDAQRVAGDVVRHYFDAEGHEIPWPGQKYLMSISRAQLRRVSMSIGVATGPEKAGAIIGAVRSGMINALVTDNRTAGHILEALE